MIHLYISEMKFDCSLIYRDGQLGTTEDQIKCISMFHKIYLRQFLIVENNFLLRKQVVIDRNKDFGGLVMTMNKPRNEGISVTGNS